MGMDPAEFPRVPAAEGATGFDLPAHVLPELIARTSYAVSRDETRPALNGVLWEIGPKELRMVATDGHRLAFYKIAGDFPVKTERQVIVPPKTLQQLQRLIKDQLPDSVLRKESARDASPEGEGAEGTERGERKGGERHSAMLHVEVTDNSIRWKMNESVIFSKLIEGPFPKYEQVIPKNNDKRLVVEREAFVEDLRAADAVTDQTSHMVRLSLKNGDVRLNAQSADIGGSDVACEGAVYEGEPLVVGYNAQYVLDALGHMSASRAEVTLKTATGPVLMRELSEKATGPGEYLCLVMPLRLPE